MKRILLLILVIGVLLLGACGAPAEAPATPTTYTLSVSVSPSGAGSVSPSGGEYEEGTQVTLSATAASGYIFDYWSGGASGSAATITITMNSDKSVIAHFKAQYTLSTSVSPEGAGTVSPAGGTYGGGTEITFTAEAASGYRFDHWGGDASGSINPIAITISSDKILIAYFTVTSWTISAEEAKQAVQSTLDLLGNAVRLEGVPGPKLPNGVEIPKNAQAGTPTLVERNGVPCWAVPVLSNGMRIGEMYVPQTQSSTTGIEFMN